MTPGLIHVIYTGHGEAFARNFRYNQPMRIWFRHYRRLLAGLLVISMGLGSLPVFAGAGPALQPDDMNHCQQYLMADANQACAQGCCEDIAACASHCASGGAASLLPLATDIGTAIVIRAESVSPANDLFLHSIVLATEPYPPR